MAISIELSLESLPELGWSSWYFGFWHPLSAVVAATTYDGVMAVCGPNYCLLSGSGMPLVHRHRGDIVAMAFRGYLSDPPLGQYSDHFELEEYWSRKSTRLHNGVFSAAIVKDAGRELQLVTDAFGIGVLYFRSIAGGVAFATHARLLGSEADPEDLIARRSYVQIGYVAGDRTTNLRVKRVGAGSVLRCTADGVRLESWFGFEQIANSTAAVGVAGVEELDAAFTEAIAKCRRIATTRTVLPLSGGDDSRRILGGLLRSNSSFAAMTVRTLHRGVYDLDGPCAEAMARHYGFPHDLLDLPEETQIAEDNAERITTLAAETRHHSWMLPMMRALRADSRVTGVFDGLGGDVLGETGFEVPAMHKPAGERATALVARHLFRETHDRILDGGQWPSLEALRHDFIEFATRYPEGDNLADVLFLLLRSRRSTGLWSQWLLPGNCIPLYPYLDLEYVTKSMAINPSTKFAKSLQRRVLEECEPELAAFVGTRNAQHDGSRSAGYSEDGKKKIERILLELKRTGRETKMRSSLSRRGRILYHCSLISRNLLKHTEWWIAPIAESSVNVYPPVLRVISGVG